MSLPDIVARALPVPRVGAGATTSAIEALVRRGSPFVVEGASSGWGNAAGWNVEVLREAIGGREVKIPTYSPGQTRHHYRKAPVLLGDYLRAVQRGEPMAGQHYVSQVRIQEELPEIAGDMTLPPIVDEERLTYSLLFCGRDSFSPLHFHPTMQAVLCQIQGKKRFLLFPPDDTRRLYPMRWRGPSFNFSNVDFEAIDLVRYPRVTRTRPVACIVDAGEMLFVPVHWWHVVHGVGVGVSVTHFWKARLSAWRFPRPGFTCVAQTMARELRRLRGRP